jgi:hypothetical protein
VSLRESFRAGPRELRLAALSRLPRIESLLTEHPQTLEEFRGCNTPAERVCYVSYPSTLQPVLSLGWKIAGLSDPRLMSRTAHLKLDY